MAIVGGALLRTLLNSVVSGSVLKSLRTEVRNSRGIFLLMLSNIFTVNYFIPLVLRTL